MYIAVLLTKLFGCGAANAYDGTAAHMLNAHPYLQNQPIQLLAVVQYVQQHCAKLKTSQERG
jgi:hypothetical protein